MQFSRVLRPLGKSRRHSARPSRGASPAAAVPASVVSAANANPVSHATASTSATIHSAWTANALARFSAGVDDERAVNGPLATTPLGMEIAVFSAR
jgi:hypothetical protein